MKAIWNRSILRKDKFQLKYGQKGLKLVTKFPKHDDDIKKKKKHDNVKWIMVEDNFLWIFFFTSSTSSLLLSYDWFVGKFVSILYSWVCFYQEVEFVNVEKETSNIYVGGME